MSNPLLRWNTSDDFIGIMTSGMELEIERSCAIMPSARRLMLLA
jgi:hypothetical protein